MLAIAAAPRQAAPTSALIDAPQLLLDLKTLSADDMEGRAVETAGNAKARAYLLSRFAAIGVPAVERPFTFSAGRTSTTQRTGVNLIATIKGTKQPDRYIVVTAHYDHIGVRNGQVFNGADDNASGTAALLALAKYFLAHKPAHSVMFVAFDAEEVGLRGARAFVADPPVPAAQIAVNLNADMIGRDPRDVLYVVGVRQQAFLKPFIDRIAAKVPVKLIMGHDNPAEKEDWTGDSDHKAFCDVKIPCLYFGVEDFDQHHRATDDYETMTHGFYVRAVETLVHAIEDFDRRLEDLPRRAADAAFNRAADAAFNRAADAAFNKETP